MNNKNDTLVILTPGFPSGEEDTTCLPLQQNLVKALKKDWPGLHIIILSFQYPYYKRTYTWFGVTVMSFNGKNKGGLPKLALRYKLYSTLKKINSSHRIIGLLSCWYNECAWVGKKFADKKGLRHFCWILGRDAMKDNKYPRRLQASGDELVALSDFLRDEFEKNHGTRPLHLITPGIDPEQFNARPLQRDIDILGAGSLIPLKQYEIFIKIIANIQKQIPGVKVMLIGAGPEKLKLQKLILKYGLQENIQLTGELPYPQVLQTMQRSRVFLHPSSYEGFSGVCEEALAAGMHVISFCKAMKKEIEQWNIVKSKEEMQQQALEILLNPDTVYKKILLFTTGEMARQMMNLFSH